MSANREVLPNHRLDSWKEIAAFFGRGERTVKRWETERGLPVHRLPGSGRSAVFAYSHELAEWLRGNRTEFSGDAAVAVVPEDSGNDELSASATPLVTEAIELRSETNAVPADSASLRRDGRWRSAAGKRNIIGVLGLAVLMVLAAGMWVSYWRSQHSAFAHSPNAEAQELYLKGRYFWSRRTPEDLTKAVDFFTQAIVKDPSDAQAYVGLADCYNLLREFGAMSPGEAYPRAIAAAQRAVELDPNSAEAHNSLAFASFWWSWQGSTAEREFQRALQLNPDFVRGHHWYATFLMARHRYAEALVEMEKAQQLDPSSTAILADKGYLLWFVGRGAEAISLLKQLEKTEPDFLSPHDYLGRIYSDQENYAAAIEEWKTAATLRHDTAGLALAQARAAGLEAGGVRGMLQAELPLQKKSVDAGAGSAYELAAAYAALGEKQDALKYLQIALDRREDGMLASDPPIPSLAGDPAYRKIANQVAERLKQ